MCVRSFRSLFFQSSMVRHSLVHSLRTQLTRSQLMMNSQRVFADLMMVDLMHEEKEWDFQVIVRCVTVILSVLLSIAF